MKNTMTKFISLFALASALCYGQTILSTTTLGAAVATSTATTITLASTSTMQGAGQTNQVNTFMWVDQECMAVTAVPSSTTVTVKRGGQSGCTGTGGVPRAHNSGAIVYFANTTTYTGTSNNIPAGRYFTNGSTNYDIVGSTCVATTELVLPKVYTFSGRMYDCLGGAWAQTNGANTPVYGSTVASATTIAPTGNVFKVSGTTAVATITIPNGFAPGQCLTVIPTGTWATTTAGNIAKVSTAVSGQTIFFCYDGAKLNGSY